MRLFTFLLMLSSAFSCLASDTGRFFGYQPDYQREARLKDEIIDAILDGDAIELKASGHNFLAIDQEPDGDNVKGAVILLHGRGFHPNWPQVTQPLRTGLAADGWRTLSLQMPVLEKDAKYFDYIWLFDEATPRIDSAVTHLKAQGIERIVLLAHSCGAHMAIHWLHQRGDKDLAAFIGIGMGATDYKQPMVEHLPLANMQVPILDVYAAKDFGAVIRLAPERRKGIRHPKSRQLVVADSEHYFTDRGDALLKAVQGWLNGL